MNKHLPDWATSIPPGGWVVLALAGVSGLGVALMPSPGREFEASMWTFAPPHYDIYEPQVDAWNQTSPHTIDLSLMSRQVMDRRMIGGFLGGVPTADLIETERSTASLAFAGPIESVGFLDLTDRIDQEGLREQISAPAFSPWTYKGRIFGLPHDVHPVMLGYRADLVEAAGIDMDAVETWDDLFEALAPITGDADADGTPDRYAMAVWDTNSDHIETLLLQAGGGAFLPDGTLAIDREINATCIAELVSWMVGPDRVATDVPEFSNAGNMLKIEAHAICYIMPDWMCNLWRLEIPSLAGKVKVMPLPAWKPGGRRTSVWGGSMLGISKVSENHDAHWEFAKHLYLSKENALELYRTGDIITPIRAHWEDPVFHEPDAYFGGQRKGSLYISLADDVPLRAATPFFTQGRVAMQSAVSRLREHAQRTETYDAESLIPQARAELRVAHEEVARIMRRNAFHRDAAPGEDG